MYGDVVLGVPHHEFEQILTAAREREGVAADSDLSADAMAEVARRQLEAIAAAGTPFPQDPHEQLWGSVGAVFRSWNNQRGARLPAPGRAVGGHGHRGQRTGDGVRQPRPELRHRRRLHP